MLRRLYHVTIVLRRRWKLSACLCLSFLYTLCSILGLTQHLYEKPFEEFVWPYHSDVKSLVTNDLLKYSSLLTASQKLGANHIGYAKGFPPPECRKRTNGKLLTIIVKSAIGNAESRIAIRDTWGKLDHVREWRVQTVFLIGIDERLLDRVREERKQTDDIIVGDFVDAYRNTTRKFLLSLLYSSSSSLLSPDCVPSDVTLLIDDDYMLNVPKLIDHLNTVDSGKDLYEGFTFHTSPFRCVLHKHAVPLSVYAYDRYPTYVSAGAVLMSRSTVKKMVLAAVYTELYNMDDVYAGILAYSLKIVPTHDERFVFWTRSIEDSEWGDVIAAHGYGPEEMRETFERVKGLQTTRE